MKSTEHSDTIVIEYSHFFYTLYWVIKSVVRTAIFEAKAELQINEMRQNVSLSFAESNRCEIKRKPGECYERSEITIEE